AVACPGPERPRGRSSGAGTSAALSRTQRLVLHVIAYDEPLGVGSNDRINGSSADWANPRTWPMWLPS
ncbi:hypothetical protein, partial [Streptomyces sp. NPDC002785]|uniref:hypothetical protein n=1 Tax=Streptomyces sp. NPDC002785 TaxID=3154543 RepID=UPI00332D4A17